VPVLAELAPEVAPDGTDGEDPGAGVEMEQGLLLDGVDRDGGDLPVRDGEEVPPRFSRTPQIPAFPSAIRHRWGHSPHRTASPSRAQYAATLPSVADVEPMEHLPGRTPGDDAIDHGGPGRPGSYEIDHALDRFALSWRTASTRRSGRLRTHPRTPAAAATRCVFPRNQTPARGRRR